jgi:hypothetical protein
MESGKLHVVSAIDTSGTTTLLNRLHLTQWSRRLTPSPGRSSLIGSFQLRIIYDSLGMSATGLVRSDATRLKLKNYLMFDK